MDLECSLSYRVPAVRQLNCEPCLHESVTKSKEKVKTSRYNLPADYNVLRDLLTVPGRRSGKLVANQRNFKSERTLNTEVPELPQTAADHCREEGNKMIRLCEVELMALLRITFFKRPPIRQRQKKLMISNTKYR